LTPRLSICIPTYNRAARLRVMLEALLPQAAAFVASGEVEVCVSDNGSPDDTQVILAAALPVCPMRVHRQPENVGVIRNIHHLVTSMARGEWVWVLGDDDLLRPGALARVVEALRGTDGPESVDALYLNFDIARVQRDWPQRAVGGYVGESDGPASPDLQSRRLERWEEALREESCLGTQVYAHVLRRPIWSGYALDGHLGEPFESPRWTFPHTFMVASAMFGKPAIYIGQPVLVIFNGGQSWTEEVPRVCMEAIPGVVEHLASLGLPAQRVRAMRKWCDHQAEGVLVNHLAGVARHPRVGLRFYLAARWREPAAWGVAGRAMWRHAYTRTYAWMSRRCPWFLRLLRPLARGAAAR
jgi:glycosyltransferase involved in cell wall biosynthesis